MQLNPRNVGASAPSPAASVSLRTTVKCKSPAEDWARVNLPTFRRWARIARWTLPGLKARRTKEARELILSWRTEAPLTSLIVAINLVIHIGVAMGGDLAVDALWDIAAMHSDSPLNPWRWFTSAWIHGNFEHVISNCLFLLIAGRLLEPTIGTARLGLLYLISIMGSSIVSLPSLYLEYIRCGGASGAVYGVIGALLVLPTCRKLWRAILVWVVVAYDVGSDMAMGPQPGIGFAAHVGGLLSGMIAGCFAGRGAGAPEEPDDSPSPFTIFTPIHLGAIGAFSRRPGRGPSNGFRVARAVEGKYTRAAVAADDSVETSMMGSEPAGVPESPDQPRRIAVISVWPDENGAEIR